MGTNAGGGVCVQTSVEVHFMRQGFLLLFTSENTIQFLGERLVGETSQPSEDKKQQG